jgi:DNA polymerase III delta subunit
LVGGKVENKRISKQTASKRKMIYLIHGQNEIDSRRFLIRLKTSYQNVQNIPGKNLSRKNLESRLSETSQALFGGKTTLLIENFEGDFASLPKKLPEGVDLILWADKKLAVTPKNIKAFLFNQVIKGSVFKLADAVLLKKEREAQVMLGSLLKNKEAPEKIIGTINRGLCLVYFVKENTINKTNLSLYLRQKHIEQARYWSKLSVKRGLLQLLSSDVAIKRGNKPSHVLTNLISHLATL